MFVINILLRHTGIKIILHLIFDYFRLTGTSLYLYYTKQGAFCMPFPTSIAIPGYIKTLRQLPSGYGNDKAESRYCLPGKPAS